MMYRSWDIKRDGQNFLPFWTIFCLFTPLTTQKIKILKKWKKTPGDIIILHMCTKSNNYMMYGSWDMACDRQLFCHFGPFFTLLPSENSKKSKFWINWKNAWKYHHFTQMHLKSWSYVTLFLRYNVWSM